MEWTESSIQGLKAQEAKDLAVEFLHKLQASEQGPISPGAVQVKELEFELQLKTAEMEDARRREAHERQIKELELKIEQVRADAQAQASRAQQVREAFAKVVERVGESGEALSTELERRVREHNLRVEQLNREFEQKQEEVAGRLEELELRRDALRAEVSDLTDLRVEAGQTSEARAQVAQLRKRLEQEQSELEERVADAEHQRAKRLRDAEREMEFALAELDAQRRKQTLACDAAAAEAILESLGKVAVEKSEQLRLQHAAQEIAKRSDEQLAELRADARAEFLREFNITRAEPADVTELYYREQAVRSESERLSAALDKLESEVRRMRQHIEQEPQRIAAAVEAARTPVQNFIEQDSKR